MIYPTFCIMLEFYLVILQHGRLSQSFFILMLSKTCAAAKTCLLENNVL